MLDTEVAWAAGIIDGEGCITITRQKPGTSGRINPSHRLFLKVTMGHEPTVRRLLAIFGVGSVHLQESSQGYNDAWSWWVASRQAGDVLMLVRPYLVTKAAEADLGFEFLALPSGTTGGRNGNAPLPAALIVERERLFAELRDAKPSARFRAAKKAAS